MKEIFLIFPTQLFSNVINLKNKIIYLIEEKRYFKDYKYHKLKLAFHRATMKNYEKYLKSKKINVKYVDFKEINNSFYEKIKNENIQFYELFDNILQNKLTKILKNYEIIDSHNFLINRKFLEEYKNEFYKNGKYNHQNFYKLQRTRLDILMNKDGSPKGGKWSFDTENRETIPENQKIPKIYKIDYKNNSIVNEAIDYINENFKDNYGSLDYFIYPIDYTDSKKWLLYFCENKFKKFGVYEDAETMRDPFLFHSVLTPMLNIGLLTDKEILQVIKKYEKKVPINSYEGFIRQIIGWRNYDLSIYLLEESKIRKMNFMKHKNKINDKIMWSGEIDILPFDNVIKKINKYAYAHHIERLMYLGNFLFLLQIKPNDVFKAFMEWTIDAYDWVMIGNVYCMSQYADGGIMMGKPYFSSSNYLLNMSDYKRAEWCEKWNALYYNFINTHQKILRKNYSWARHVSFWNKKPLNERKKILSDAKNVIKEILS